MNKQKNNNELAEIYQELKKLYTLLEVKNESLYYCYEENKEYGHVFAFDNILFDKFNRILGNLEKMI